MEKVHCGFRIGSEVKYRSSVQQVPIANVVAHVEHLSFHPITMREGDEGFGVVQEFSVAERLLPVMRGRVAIQTELQFAGEPMPRSVLIFIPADDVDLA